MIGAQESEFKTERRSRLDGGLNSRGSPLALEAEDAESISDFRLTEAGALVPRKYAQLKLQGTWSADGKMVGPTLTQLAGGGSLPAGDYEVKYALEHVAGSSVDLQSASALTTITGINLNDRIQIDIPCNNLGEGVGQSAAGADDPFHGGAVNARVLVRKTTDALFTQQVLSTAFAWNGSARVQRAVISAYSVGSTVPANAGSFPLRHIFWHPGIQRLIGWVVDRAILFASDLASFSRFPETAADGAAVDKSNAIHFWSRLPARLKNLLVDNFAIVYDGISRPKSLHWTGNIATSQWRLIGANPPATAPTLAQVVGGGALSTGTYKYRVTYSYRHTRGVTSLSTADCESNSIESAGQAVNANDRITVTLPSTNESGAYSVNIYRTAVNGATFFFVAAVAEGTATYTDGAADATITANDQPPDADAKGDGNDMPPNALDHLVFYNGSIWGVENEYQLDTSSRITGLIATNRIRHSKFSRLSDTGQGRLGGDPTEIRQREQIDAWPSRFSFESGEADPITGMVAAFGRVYVFKANSVRVFSGTSVDDLTEDELFPGVGAMRDSVHRDGPYIYFWDEAIGPCRMTGTDWEAIGYLIQPTWNTDRAAGFYPLTTFKDKQNRELHFVLSNLSLTPPGNINAPMSMREYVLYLPTMKWTQFTTQTSGSNPPSRSIGAAALGVLSTDLGRQVLTLLLADFRGRLLQDNQQNVDEDGSTVRTASVMFRFFFGDAWEVVKLIRFLYLYFDIGEDSVTGSITVKVGLLSSQTLQTLTTISAGLMGNNVFRDIVKRIDWKANLVTRPGIGGEMNHERALLVQIESNSPTHKIKGIALKYKDESDQQDAV